MLLAQTVEAASSYSVGTVCGGLACLIIVAGIVIVKVASRNAKRK